MSSRTEINELIRLLQDQRHGADQGLISRLQFLLNEIERQANWVAGVSALDLRARMYRRMRILLHQMLEQIAEVLRITEP